jgi:site-specific recombinase XerD
MVLYGTGMRRAEIARLKIADIDSQRMILHVVDGKGHKDRDLRFHAAFGGLIRGYPLCVMTEASVTRRSLRANSKGRCSPVGENHQLL